MEPEAMSKLRHSMNSARCAYESRRYEGSLARELGLHGHEARSGRRWWRWAAIAALIGVSVYLLRTNDTPTPTSPAAPQQAVRPTSPDSPDVAPTPDAGVNGGASRFADANTDESAELASTEPDSFQLSAPSTSISFTEITGLPSVSAMPAIGGLPSLDSASTSSTTQESAS